MSYVSYLPDFLKQSSPVAKVEVPPDVPAILRSNINILFVSTSAPTNIQYSLPVPAKHGGWETRILKLDRLRSRATSSFSRPLPRTFGWGTTASSPTEERA
jgi:hypothetical protein